MNKDSPYIMTYKQGFVDIAPKLQPTELKVFALIFNNTNFGNVSYLRKIDLANQLSMDYSNLSKRVKKLVTMNLMRKTRKGFMLNPEYFMLGPMEDRPKLISMYNKLDSGEKKRATAK